MCNLLRSAVLIASATVVTSWCRAEPSVPARSGPLSAEEALKQFQLPAGLKIELVAAEPEVIDPVAAVFDEDGRLWVVEMRDYPNRPNRGHPPQSQIKVLQDQDGDGRYEASQVFADGLTFCTGLQPWRGGVIVTLAGEVAYFRDNDGDGRAEQRETWFTGFAAENSQLRASHPTLALDNHVYVANGLRGGEISAARELWRDGAQPLSIRGMDFRFDPRTGQSDAVTGHSQFGLAFDDFGCRFICTNRNPCVQVVLEDHYIRRNKHLAISSVVHDTSPPAEKSRLFPLSRAWTTSNLHAGQFTAACGVTIYRGDALPGEFYGNSFTCEPTANLVHRDVLEREGIVFRARPMANQSEFLASTDEWFRPVNLTHGPDGALYVIDMYRAVIEHPDFMPEELKQRPENNAGNERGRLYRIVPTDLCTADYSRRSPKLSLASNDELIGLLEHANGWRRETAARLLLERGDQAACGQLRSLALQSKSPQARVHALWLLKGFDQLSAETVRKALDDVDPRVQAQAVRLAEPWLNSNDQLRQRVLTHGNADHALLRFQVALSLGEIRPVQQPDEVVATLADIAVRDADNPWIRKAVATSLTQRASPVMRIVLQRAIEPHTLARPGLVELTNELAQLIGANQDAAEIGGVFAWLEPFVQSTASLAAIDVNLPDQRSDFALACLNGLGQGSRRRGKSLADFVPRFSAHEQQCHDRIFAAAARIALDTKMQRDRRCQAVRTLPHANFSAVRETLFTLAAVRQDPTVRRTAIEVLASFDDPSIGPALFADFSQQTPALRRAIISAALDKVRYTALLLDELEAGRVSPAALQPDHWQRLVAHRNPELGQRARRLQAAAAPADRRQVIETYRAALKLAANPHRGQEIFAKNCAGCHRLAGMGVNVAPDISDSRAKQPEQLLIDILDPNRAIDNNYFSYAIILTDGQVVTGIIGSETATSITLRQQEGKARTILRDDIEQLRSNGVSLMPAGLEQTISVRQMADLIAFLKNWRYLEGPSPQPVTQHLFNGKNFDGWYVYTTETQQENPGVFQVVDGMIYVPGGQGDTAYFGGLITKQAYENYRLQFEYKWGEATYGRRQGKARDAGVLLHCIGPNEPGPWMTSYEFQVIEGGTGDLLIVNARRNDEGNPLALRCTAEAVKRNGQRYFAPGGDHLVIESGRLNWHGRDPKWRDDVGFRGRQDVESPHGQWTKCEILARGDTLEYYVNGKLVNRATALSNRRGKIFLQTEGAEVWYRNIVLTPLGLLPKP